MIKTVLFDLDGTLLNTIDDLAIADQNCCAILYRKNIKIFWIFEAVPNSRHFVTDMISLLIRTSFGHHRIFKIKIKFFKYITTDFDVIFLEIWFLSVIFYCFKHTTGRCHMAYAVDQNHLAKCLVFLKLVKNDLLSQFDLTQSNLIFLNMIC